METDESKETMALLNSIILKEDKSKTLLEHLQKLYETRTEMGDDRKFLDFFEEISLKLKHDGSYLKKDGANSVIFNYLNEFNNNIKQKKELLDPLVKRDEDGNNPESVGEIKNVPEYHNLFQFIEWTGYSLGEKESYILTNSLRNLCFKGTLGWVRFWGKIYGTKRDYFIAEAPAVERGNSINNIFRKKRRFSCRFNN
jgi:radial spoke head protein 4A